MARYAQNTSVSVSKSKAEIESLLERYGAQEFASGWTLGKAMIGFSFHNRHVRFVLTLPDREDKEFRYTRSKGRERSDQDAHRAWEQACRQSWRALALVIKAKLEAVEAGITTFDDEFLAHIVDPLSGKTIGEWMAPQLENAYETGMNMKLLPCLSDK